MSDTNDLTEQLPTMLGTDGCAPPVHDGNGVTPLLHKVSVQEVASSMAAIKFTLVNKMNGVAVWYSVGDSFAQQPAAPEAHRIPVNAGSSIIGMPEVIERDSTKNLAELSLAEDEAENGSNVSNGFTVWNSVGVSFAHQPAAPEDHRSSGAAGSSNIRMLEVIERDFTKSLKEPSLEEDEAESGYQKDTQENNVTKASNANGALYVLEFEHTVIFATSVKYVQKTTSPFVLISKQSRRSARLFVSIQKLVLSRI